MKDKRQRESKRTANQKKKETQKEKGSVGSDWTDRVWATRAGEKEEEKKSQRTCCYYCQLAPVFEIHDR